MGMVLKIIGKDLCWVDEEKDTLLKRYQPVSKIIEFRKVGSDCIIIHEDPGNYNSINSNIYCLDDNFHITWYAETPHDKDAYPNRVEWNKEINDNSTGWENYDVENPNTFTTASRKGFTVTIDYKTGKIIKSLFTK